MAAPLTPARLPGVVNPSPFDSMLDATAEHLKAEEANKPIPSSAVMFADKLLKNQNVKTPKAELANTSALVSPSPIGDWDKQPQQMPGLAAEQAGASQTGALFGALRDYTGVGILAKMVSNAGTLSDPKDQAVAADEWLARENAKIPQDQAAVDIQKRMKDTLAAQPFDMPGELRPLRGDERRDNPDGSYSTELEMTVVMPDGKVANIPSLWTDGSNPQEFDEKQAIQQASEYERLTGKTFPRFDTPDAAKGAKQTPEQKQDTNIKTAVAAAEKRSAAGGAGGEQKPLAQSDVEAAEERAIADKNAKLIATVARRNAAQVAVDTGVGRPTQTWWLNAIQQGAKSGLMVGTNAGRALAGLGELIDATIGGTEPQRNEVRAYIDGIDKKMNEMLPGDKTKSATFVNDLSSGVGSMAAFLLGGVIGRAVGGGTSLVSGVLGGLSQAGQMYDEADKHGATIGMKYLTLLTGMGIGATEAIPIDRMFHRAEQATGGLVTNLLKTTSAGSMEEFIQEFGQAAGGDIAAKTLYDPNRKLDFDDWFYQGTLGGIIGGGTSAGVHLLEAGKTTAPVDAGDSAEKIAQAQAMGERIMARADAEFDAAIPPEAPVETNEEIGAELPQDAPVDEAVVQPVETAEPVDVAVAAEEEKVAAATEQAVAEAEEAATPQVELTPEAGQLLETLGIDPAAIQQAADTVVGTEDQQAVALRTQKKEFVPPAIEKAPQAYKGGTVPALRPDGKVELTHWSSEPVQVLDPAVADTRTKPSTPELRRAGGPNWVPRVYYGVDASFKRPKANIAAQNEANKTGAPNAQAGLGYVNEGLSGAVRHTVAVDPDTLYNWIEDPMGFDAQLTSTTPAERATEKEKMIKDAGFAGAWFERSPVGATATLFTPQAVESIHQDATKQWIKAPPSGQPLPKNMEKGSKRPAGWYGSPEELAARVQSVQLDDAALAKLPGLFGTSTGPIPSVLRAAHAYAQDNNIPIRRQTEYVQADPERGARIAREYENMEHDPNNPAVAAAFEAMIQETLAQYQYVKASGLQVEFIEPGMEDPYQGKPTLVLEDLTKGHLWTFPTDQGFGSLTDAEASNPLLRPTGEYVNGRQLLANDVFRIVHDFFGHGVEGSGFTARGEENAWQSHMRLYTERALPAVTSETRGQNSWVNFGPHGANNRANPQNTIYADQKTGLMPSWTWQEGVEDGYNDSISYAVATPERIASLSSQIPGLKGVLKYMTPDERAKLSNRNAARIVDIFTNMPSPKEMAAVAFSGRAKRGWYNRSAAALVDIFGVEDAPRFAALLAALSPQTSVESNAINALNAWTNWIRAGRPQEPARIKAILGMSVQGGKGEGSVLGAWINNSITALTVEDANDITLSGPKVDSFMKNLQGRTIEVTNDAWMANYANVDQTLFAKTGPAPGKGAGYIGMSAAVRQAAEIATKMTGEQWTPAEIQETVWSWAKTLYEKAGSAGENRTAAQIIAAGDMTAEEIGATPDFATLFVGGVYRNILEKGGYNVDLIATTGSAGPDGSAGGGGRPVSAEGSGLAQSAFEKQLARAAARLDALRERRKQQAETSEDFDLEETFFPYSDEALGKEETFLDNDDLDALDEGTMFMQTADEGWVDDAEAADDTAAMTANNRAPYVGEQVRRKAVPDTSPTSTPVDENLTSIGQLLVRLIGATVRTGRLMRVKGVQGQYNFSSGVLRMKSKDDLSTLTHEAGHALHDNRSPVVNQFIDQNEAAVIGLGASLYPADLSNATVETQRKEGFAEFFRIFTLNRAYARKRFPTLTNGFEAMLNRESPEILKGLDAIGSKFETWLHLPSTAMVKSFVTSSRKPSLKEEVKTAHEEGTLGQMVGDFTRKVMSWGLNKYIPLDTIVNGLLRVSAANGRLVDLKRAYDPRALARLAQNSSARAMVQVRDGVMGYRSNTPETAGLQQAIMISQGLQPNGKAKGGFNQERLDDFDAYLVAKRVVVEYRNQINGDIDRAPVGFSLFDAERAIIDFEAKYGQSFVQAAQLVHEYGMALWKKGFDAGMMTRETYLEGLKRTFYVPLMRDMSDRGRSDLGASVLTRGETSIVKRFRGSDRNIISPLEALMQKTFALEKTIQQNEVKKTLAALAGRAGTGAGEFAERIPANKLVGSSFTVQAVAKQLSSDPNISEVDAQDLIDILSASMDDGAMITMFRSDVASTLGENIMFFWENGKLQALQLKDGETGAAVIDLLHGVGTDNMPLGTEIIAVTSGLFRSTITLWPDFAIVNYIRDQASAWLLTDVGYVPFWTGAKGIKNEVRQSKLARDYNASMGIMGGMQVSALHEAKIDHELDALKSRGYLMTVFEGSGFKGAAQGMARLTGVTETGTRMGIFEAAYNRAIAEGLNEYEAGLEAAYTATDYINFGQHGSRTMFLRRTVPFLNAAVQGLYKQVRAMGGDEARQRIGITNVLRAYLKGVNGMELTSVERKQIVTGKKLWIKMIGISLIGAIIAFAYRDDEDYQGISEYMRNTNWVIPTGGGRFIAIPKPFQLAIFNNIVERSIESANGDDKAMWRMLKGVGQMLAVPSDSPLTSTYWELAQNRDTFTGRDIVPDYMQSLPAELQYNQYTSEIAKQVAKMTGMSALKVDHLLGSIGASAANDLRTVTNQLNPNSGTMDPTDAPILRRFYKDATRGNAATRDFWDQASQANGRLRQIERGYKHYIDVGNEAAANVFLERQDEDGKAYALLMTHDTDAKRLHPMVRSRQISTLVSEMRREIASDIGLDDTGMPGERIVLTPKMKTDADNLLSDFVTRDIRNTMIVTEQPGWKGKKLSDVSYTMDIIRQHSPALADELDRRLTKAKVYNADVVYEGWPDLKNRLLQDREFAVLSDLTAIAKSTPR